MSDQIRATPMYASDFLSIRRMVWICLLGVTPMLQAAFMILEDLQPPNQWPNDPLPVATSASSPQVSGSGVGANGNVLAQTFVAPSDFDLKAVAFSYWTAGADVGSLTFSLYEIPDALAATIPTSGSPDLLGGGAGLDYTPYIVTSGSGADEDLMVVNFFGADVVSLTSGTHYALQVAGTGGVSFTWGREGSGGSIGGRGYVNGSPIAGLTRDFKMALYDSNVWRGAVPEPSSFLLTLTGLALISRVRTRRLTGTKLD